MTDHEILLKIHEMLDGKVWDVELLDIIAALLDDNGYTIRDPYLEVDDAS